MSADTVRAMDEWAPRRQLSLAQARTRTRIVHYMRFGLVAAAAVTLAVFLAYIARNAYDRANGDDNPLNTSESVSMINPRFTGRDGNGDLYVITATRADRRRDNEDLIDLENPRLVDAFGTEVTAPIGLFARDDETLELYEDVLLVDSEGYIFNSTHAMVMTATRQVIGVEPLEGTGPLGDISANAYEADNDSGIVTFLGRVQVTLFEAEDVGEEISE